MLKLKVTNKENRRKVFLEFPCNYTINPQLSKLFDYDMPYLSLTNVGNKLIDVEIMHIDNEFDKLITDSLKPTISFQNIFNAYFYYNKANAKIKNLILCKLRDDANFSIKDVSMFVKMKVKQEMKKGDTEFSGRWLMNAQHLIYEEMTLLGKQVLFSDYRISHDSVPNGLYIYEAGSDDEIGDTICRLSNYVYVNHIGTILTSEEIKLGKSGRRFIDEERDIVFDSGNAHSIKEYLRKFPVNKKIKDKER